MTTSSESPILTGVVVDISGTCTSASELTLKYVKDSLSSSYISIISYNVYVVIINLAGMFGKLPSQIKAPLYCKHIITQLYIFFSST